MNDIKIAIAYHKPAPIVKGDIYLPLHVGKAMHPEVNLGLQTDAEGDNISDENGYYCELTAIYWLWKNVTASYKGLCHYRRVFSHRLNLWHAMVYPFPLLAKPNVSPNIKYTDADKFVADAETTAKHIASLLDKCDIIAPKKNLSGRTCYSHFLKETSVEFLAVLDNIVKEKDPEYHRPLRRAFRAHRYYFGNMSVMRSYYFDEYCTFMFGVLEELKRRFIDDGYLIDLKSERMFARKLGYLGEVLTHVYLSKKESDGVKVKRLNIAYLDV